MEVNLADYEHLCGTDDLFICEYVGDGSAPEYVLADDYGNQFQFESGEIAELAQLFEQVQEYDADD